MDNDANRPRHLAKTLLGFDFGMRRIGIAIGQTLTQSASPLTTLIVQKGVPQWSQLDEIVHTWQPDGLVVGIPLNMDGTEQDITHFAKQFAEQLQTRYKLPVYSADERLTSVEAKAQLYAKGGYKALQQQSIDSLAAQLILEAWLREIAAN